MSKVHDSDKCDCQNCQRDKPKPLTRAKLMAALVTIGLCNKGKCEENLCPRIRATIDALFEYREQMRSFIENVDRDAKIGKELNLD